MSRAGYLSPDRAEQARYAGLHRRAAAGAIDWALCYVAYLLVSIPAGMVQAVARLIGGVAGNVLVAGAIAVPLAVVPAYFAWLWTSGQTFGMRALELHLVVARSGEAPSLWRTVPRSAVALVLGVAVYLVLFAAITERPVDDPYSSGERTLIAAALAVAAAGALAKLWSLVDRRRQSLLDRVFGVLVLDELQAAGVAPSARYPWVDVRSNSTSAGDSSRHDPGPSPSRSSPA